MPPYERFYVGHLNGRHFVFGFFAQNFYGGRTPSQQAEEFVELNYDSLVCLGIANLNIKRYTEN